MFTLTCKAYKDGRSIPAKYTHHSVGGENISPGFVWDRAPAMTQSFAFSIVDPHPVAKNWVHWLVVDLPGGSYSLPEHGSLSVNMPAGAKELQNTYKELGYGGPAPPLGTGPHPYIATIFALSVASLDLPAATTLKQFQQAIEGKTLAHATMTGFFERR